MTILVLASALARVIPCVTVRHGSGRVPQVAASDPVVATNTAVSSAGTVGQMTSGTLLPSAPASSGGAVSTVASAVVPVSGTSSGGGMIISSPHATAIGRTTMNGTATRKRKLEKRAS